MIVQKREQLEDQTCIVFYEKLIQNNVLVKKPIHLFESVLLLLSISLTKSLM